MLHLNSGLSQPPVDQLGQFRSGIRFYSRGWHVENLRYFVDRLLVVIDQVDDLTMLGRQSHQCSAHQFAPILFLQCDFRVIRRVRETTLALRTSAWTPATQPKKKTQSISVLRVGHLASVVIWA
jgi:hypothetical protein